MIESANHAIAAGLIFLIAYALIASERIHRTIVAVAGAAAVLALRLVDQETAFGTGRPMPRHTVAAAISAYSRANSMRPSPTTRKSSG